MKTVVITREQSNENQTIGSAVVFGDEKWPLFAALSLERGWRDNEPDISCIPTGTYKLIKEYSPAFDKDLWEIKGVEGREECKFHVANYWRQLKGCIALGISTTDIDGDGFLDITNSGQTMDRFHIAMGQGPEARLIVKND